MLIEHHNNLPWRSEPVDPENPEGAWEVLDSYNYTVVAGIHRDVARRIASVGSGRKERPSAVATNKAQLTETCLSWPTRWERLTQLGIPESTQQITHFRLTTLRERVPGLPAPYLYLDDNDTLVAEWEDGERTAILWFRADGFYTWWDDQMDTRSARIPEEEVCRLLKLWLPARRGSGE